MALASAMKRSISAVNSPRSMKRPTSQAQRKAPWFATHFDSGGTTLVR